MVALQWLCNDCVGNMWRLRRVSKTTSFEGAGFGADLRWPWSSFLIALRQLAAGGFAMPSPVGFTFMQPLCRQPSRADFARWLRTLASPLDSQGNFAIAS